MTVTTAGADAPQWSARPICEADHDAVLAMFEEPDFYFRTNLPDTRSQREILELLDKDVRLLMADGRPVGLYGVESLGSEAGSNYQLEFRLRSSAPPSWWRAAYEEIVRALRWRRELVRILVRVGEYDERALAAARDIGLDDEGTLEHLVVLDGRRHGHVFFSQIWAPTS